MDLESPNSKGIWCLTFDLYNYAFASDQIQKSRVKEMYGRKKIRYMKAEMVWTMGDNKMDIHVRGGGEKEIGETNEEVEVWSENRGCQAGKE